MKNATLLFLILFFTVSSNAQINDSIAKKLNNKLDNNIEKMLKNAFYPKYDLSSCKPTEFYRGIDKSRIFINNNITRLHWQSFIATMRLPSLKGDYDKGVYKTIHDKAMDLALNSKKASLFIKTFSGKDLGYVNADDQKKLRQYFKRIKSSEFDEFLGENKFNHGGCDVVARSFLKLKKLKLGAVVWEYTTQIYVTCICGEADTSTSLKEASYIVKATSVGKLSYDTLEFGEIEKPTLDIKKEKCCGDSNDEDASIQVDPNENISLPEQTIGVSGGIGFQQDFEETSFCLGAEYLYNATNLGDCPLYVGANAQFATTSFMDFSNTWVSVGPTAQVFSPITPSEEVHMTNGINANYVFGTNNNNGIKDNISGFGVSLNTGLNVQLKENFALSLIVPLVSYSNLTFESQEGGGSVDVSDTTVLLNKDNPIKIGLRIGF